MELSLSRVIADFKSPSKVARIRAIDSLTICFARFLDLEFTGWLLRGVDSDGIEAGGIASDRHVTFRRWQIQCCNAPKIDVEEIATALGRSVPFKPNILLSATSGRFTQRAYHYVARAMQLTNLQIFLIDGHDLAVIAHDEAALQSILGREAKKAKSVKKSQLEPLMRNAPEIAREY